jgi:hypothetical protein
MLFSFEGGLTPHDDGNLVLHQRHVASHGDDNLPGIVDLLDQPLNEKGVYRHQDRQYGGQCISG